MIELTEKAVGWLIGGVVILAAVALIYAVVLLLIQLSKWVL
jgi:hypothetical protein